MNKCKKHNLPFGFYCGFWGCRVCLIEKEREKDKNRIQVDSTIGKAIKKNE